MALNGSDILVLINTGTEESPMFEPAGCQRDGTMEEGSAVIDVSCKGNRARRVLAGRYTSTISLDGLYIPGDSAFDAMRQANRNGELVLLAREESGVVVETAYAVISSMSQSFPDQDAAVISASFEIDGMWTEVGS